MKTRHAHLPEVKGGNLSGRVVVELKPKIAADDIADSLVSSLVPTRFDSMLDDGRALFRTHDPQLMAFIVVREKLVKSASVVSPCKPLRITKGLDPKWRVKYFFPNDHAIVMVTREGNSWLTMRRDVSGNERTSQGRRVRKRYVEDGPVKDLYMAAIARLERDLLDEYENAQR